MIDERIERQREWVASVHAELVFAEVDRITGAVDAAFLAQARARS